MVASQNSTESPSGSPDTSGRSFVGRTDALAWLDRRLQNGHLVEIVGIPGIGKSRLARRCLACRRREQDEQWIRLDLRPHPGLHDALAELADACNVDTDSVGSTGELASKIGGRLASRGIDGVLLDNAEALSRDAGLIHTLVESAFGVAWLATCRTPLAGVASETLQLGPLPAEQAAELFRLRARDHWMGTGHPSTDDQAVERLVDLLDGHPLAIEAAAGRINALPPDALANRLAGNRSADSPDSGVVPAVERLFEDAWHSLEKSDRRLLADASTFAGPLPFRLVDALAEADQDPGGIGALEQLVRSGWLEPLESDGGERAYRIPEMLKNFVRRQLEADGGARRIIDRHARIVSQEADTLADRLVRTGDRSVADRLRRRVPELITIFDRLAGRAPARAVRALLPLRWLVRLDWLTPPIRRRLDRACDPAILESCSPSTAGLIQSLAAEIRHRAGEPNAAAELATEACRRIDETVEASTAAELHVSASLPLASLDLDSARQQLDSALERLDGLDRPVLEARAYERLGFVDLSNFALVEAREAFQTAHRALRRTDHHLFLPSVLTGLGYVDHRLDRPETARNTFREALDIAVTTDRTPVAAAARFNLGVVLLAGGDKESARKHLDEAADTLSTVGRPTQAAAARLRLGLAELELGDGERGCSSLRDALEIARRADDSHNQALAEALLALVGDDPRPDQLTLPLRDLQFDADPDAAAALLAYATVTFADADRPDQTRLCHRQLLELVSVLSSEDRYLNHVVETTIGACRFALESLDRADLVDEHDGPRIPPDQLADTDNPFARLVGRGFAELLSLEDDEPDSRIIPATDNQTHHLRVHRRGHWFVVDQGDPVDLTSREPLRRILSELVAIATDESRRGASVDDLIEAGWPEAEPTRSSGANRVYYTIRKLREFGLEDVLVTSEQGYRLGDSAKLRISSTPFDELGPRDSPPADPPVHS